MIQLFGFQWCHTYPNPSKRPSNPLQTLFIPYLEFGPMLGASQGLTGTPVDER